MRPRCVLVERPTEYQELIARHGTHELARFFLAQRQEAIEPVEQRHRAQLEYHAGVLGAIPTDWRRASVDRSDLDRFLFESDDIVVVLGQDGLVANVAKYLDGQPVIGLNPDPDRYPGVLVRHAPQAAADLLRDVAAGRAASETRTMVEATVDDGQSLRALNEVFVGHASHQSARYRLSVGAEVERQSSSGVVVTTGTGATGWAASLHLERHSRLRLPAADEKRLAFFVREAWPSVATGTTMTEGALGAEQRLEIVSEMLDHGVVFGDGIENDRIGIAWGQRVAVGIAPRGLTLVR
jgi:NAD kinase